MADLYPVAGAKIYIGPVTATQAENFELADFETPAIAEEDWVAIDGWETAGAYGDSSELITTQLINRGRDIKQKGTRNAGSMANVFAEIQGDAGQAAMEAAEESPQNYAFRIIYDDVPSGGSNGTTHFFVGLVTQFEYAGGGANTTRMANATIELNSNIVKKAAA